VTRNDPALAEMVCLALVAEGPTHGWAVSGLLAPDGEIGRIWSLSRPLTYRALEQLVSDGLIAKVGTTPGAGRSRTLLDVTDAGRKISGDWLDEPVELPRDVRTELLLKFACRTRVELSIQPLALRQREKFALLIDEVAKADPSQFVGVWRREHLLAIDRFLEIVSGAPS
jgi:DNA-binding PadR family transcriptional regulator